MPYSTTYRFLKALAAILIFVSMSIGALKSMTFAFTSSSASKPDNTQQLQAEEERIVAALIWNFLLFIEFPSPQETFVVGVIGTSRVEAFLTDIARQKRLSDGRAVEVRHLNQIDEISRCQAVFISPSEGSRLQQILTKTRGKSILTIGRENDFLLRGGMMNFYIENTKVRFEYNNDEIASGKLRCSSQLLRHGRQYSKAKE